MNQINNGSETQSCSEGERLVAESGADKYEQNLQNLLDPAIANELIQNLASEFKGAKKSEFESYFQVLVSLVRKGFASEILKHSAIIVRLMKQFISLCSLAESDPKAEIQVICILSMIAELMREGRRFQFPLSPKFVKSVLLIDEQLLESSPQRDSILAILGVIYESISRQVNFLRRFGLVKSFKTAVLTNYHLVTEEFSARLFNKSLYYLAIQGQQITEAELFKFRVFQTVSKFIGSQQTDTLISKMRRALKPSLKTQMIAQI